MDARRLGRVHRALRHRLGLTQCQLSASARVQRNKISELENGNLSRVTVPELDRCFAALSADVRAVIDWHGAAVDRLLDEGHAMLAGAAVTLLRQSGWLVEFEVTFARFRDRGSIDLLAWHAATRTLLVIEVKTELGSLEGLLRSLDTKVRLAAVIAAERFGWHANVVAKLVVMPEDRSVRRTAERHAEVLRSVFPMRTRAVRSWLGEPVGPMAGMMFLTSSQLVGTKRNPSAIQRVRHARNKAAQGSSPA